jgi:hypothetical protein
MVTKRATSLSLSNETKDKIEAIIRRYRLVTGDNMSRSELVEKLVADFDLENFNPTHLLTEA